ncbi:MAG: ATP-binding protein [Smithellaceae bacterium]|nr:ATP-binding protein [Smithellaceae bacterium]
MERLVATYLFDPEITADKMIFLTGPRQVGKTTFARDWLDSAGYSDTYFNWDDPALILEYRRNPLFFKNIVEERYKGKPVPVVFDEIHKQKNWRDILKGFYDSNRKKIRLLVTGSSRLGMYRKSGDSLIGRYFSYRMFPVGIAEAVADFSLVLRDDLLLANGESLLREVIKVDMDKTRDALEGLIRFGGFPEPFLKASPKFHRRWQTDYKTLLTREDVRDLSRIADIRGLEHLVELLPSKVGSPLSINSLREDLNCHHSTITKWIDVLKEVYLAFTIRPWHRQIQRSLKKEPKLYFYDWSLLSETGPRFENLLAVGLMRMAARLTETGIGLFEVMYIRDTAKREVDFVLVKDGKPLALFEVKESGRDIAPALRHFSRILKIPGYQIVRDIERAEAFPDNCFLIPAAAFLMLTG